jgi:hypothetical protein
VAAVLGVCVAVGAAQASDLVTFLRMMDVHGPAAELNPLVSRAFVEFGVPMVVAFKFGLIVLVVATFAIVARRYSRVAAAVATIATLVGLVGAYSNILALS